MSEYIIEYLPDTTTIEHEEIVRCRDCEHYQRDQCCELFVLADDRLSHIDDPDGFCAWGEVRAGSSRFE